METTKITYKLEYYSTAKNEWFPVKGIIWIEDSYADPGKAFADMVALRPGNILRCIETTTIEKVAFGDVNDDTI